MFWYPANFAAVLHLRQIALAVAVGLASGCVSPATRSTLMPQNVEGIVTLHIGVTPAEVGGNPPKWAMRFVPWGPKTFPPVRMVALPRIPDDNGGAIDGEVWEVVFSTRGEWTTYPDFANCFEWQLDRREQSHAFALNRQALFELYRQHVPELAQFVLLRRAGDPTRFMAFMLYGLNARNVPSDQPDIKKFETANPLSRWSAHEVYPSRGYLAHQL